MDQLAIIVNNKAQNASLFKDYQEAFDQHGLKYKLVTTDPSLLEQTIQQCKESCSLLLVGGGDGTVRSAAHLCAQSNVTLGVLPLGTLNHFFTELALPQAPDELVNAIKERQSIYVDLAEVNGIKFINNSSIGVYPHFARKRDEYSRFYNKWLSYLPGLIESLRTHETFHITLDFNDQVSHANTCFLMISNNLYSYQFPLTLKREQFNKAMLGIYLYKHTDLNPIRLLKSLFNQHNSFVISQSEHEVRVTIENQEEISVSLDGDTKMLKSPLVYKSLPRALAILKNNL
ncbi:diacylglycerol/lipid kinase family protein [Legionella impletisoli]|uniref:Diacylglycerol kinase n=1 Tax=Legionella impletisoli TaxID=343510 RepID=A0A917JY16_9GAMM|nr:diacylglycerol kinase family protein [Legionella impletisoli]GGI92135.1 diacylglycerol kinase [Legionella impletisoli]